MNAEDGFPCEYQQNFSALLRIFPPLKHLPDSVRSFHFSKPSPEPICSHRSVHTKAPSCCCWFILYVWILLRAAKRTPALGILQLNERHPLLLKHQLKFLDVEKSVRLLSVSRCGVWMESDGRASWLPLECLPHACAAALFTCWTASTQHPCRNPRALPPNIHAAHD